MFRSFQLTMEHPQFTFSTNTPDTTALANIYSQQWQQLNDYLLQLNQSNFQIHDPQPTETKERRTKVAKSDEAHTSPSHLETPQATQIEENTTKHNNTLGKDQCPICLIKLTRESFEEHMNLELAKLDDVATDSIPIVPDSELTSNRNKREAALFARKQVQRQMETQSSKSDDRNPLEILKTVRQNRASRRKEKSSPISSHASTRKSKTPSQECPICTEKLVGNLDDINAHIDACLGQQNGNSNNSKKPKKSTSKRKKSKGNKEEEEYHDEDVETYTWGGVTRVRTCSLLENGYTGLFGISNSKASAREEEAELDIENDEISKFGASQYSESDLIVRGEEEDTKIIRERVTGGNFDSKLKFENSTHEDLQPKPEGLHSNQNANREDVSLTNDTNGSLFLMIDALKEKIREQESRLANSYKCLICLENYQTPLVSVNCWHVYCEKCWLSSLGAMKLCPQCKVITSPSDLRKIFL